MISASLEDLDARTRAWLDLEQTVNERLLNPAYLPIDHRSNTVRPALYPERRQVWRQEVTWLPPERTRVYGPLAQSLKDAFGHPVRSGHVPLLLHPQIPPVHRRLARAHGVQPVGDVWSTPTSSYRTVLSWRRGRAPVMLKLSIGATISRIWRALRENQVSRAVLMTAVFDTLPRRHLDELGFDWFSEPAGMVETQSRHGWLLRRFPKRTGVAKGTRLAPMFSLISATPTQAPWLVELIRRSGQRAENFVLEKLVEPFVQTAAYLMFAQGIQIEVHAQNLMVELGRDGELTGRVALRDLSDQSCSIPLRVARGRPLPVFPKGQLATGAPFPLATIAADTACNDTRPKLFRAFDTVERYGLWGFVWSTSTSLARFFPGYDAAFVEDTYFDWWQTLTERYLGIKPLFRRGKVRALAIDETLAAYLGAQDWRALGASGGHALPEDAEFLKLHLPRAPKRGPVYDRLECAWGDLYFHRNVPTYIRPAF